MLFAFAVLSGQSLLPECLIVVFDMFNVPGEIVFQDRFGNLLSMNGDGVSLTST